MYNTRRNIATAEKIIPDAIFEDTLFASDNSHKNHHESDYEKNVNEQTEHREKDKSHEPEHKQNNCNSEKHYFAKFINMVKNEDI